MELDLWNTHAGNFRACIDLRKLHEMTNSHFRKLLRIAYTDLEENEVELDLLETYLERRCASTLEEWDKASRRFTDEWKLVNKHKRDPETLEILRHNRELKKDVARARSLHTRYQALKSIFNEEKEKNK